MACDVCKDSHAKKRADGNYRCDECAKLAESRPEWSSYVKEVVNLDRCNDDFYRKWIRKGKTYYKGRML